jgi:hypothetical protein
MTTRSDVCSLSVITKSVRLQYILILTNNKPQLFPSAFHSCHSWLWGLQLTWQCMTQKLKVIKECTSIAAAPLVHCKLSVLQAHTHVCYKHSPIPCTCNLPPACFWSAAAFASQLAPASRYHPARAGAVRLPQMLASPVAFCRCTCKLANALLLAEKHKF